MLYLNDIMAWSGCAVILFCILGAISDAVETNKPPTDRGSMLAYVLAFAAAAICIGAFILKLIAKVLS
jgi:hypothetical protein